MLEHDGHGPGRRYSRRDVLKTIGLGAAALGVSACGVTTGSQESGGIEAFGKAAATGRKAVVELYNVFGGEENQNWIRLARMFEETQPDIGVQITYAPAGGGGGGDNPKLLTAIAGGTPPDLAQLTPFSTPQWAELGVMTDLTEYFAQRELGEDAFFPAAWNDMNWRGKQWQIQWDADPNFPFFWNKGLFEEVGLDPEVPPKTIEEVNEFSKRINVVRDGLVQRIGILPWDSYGFSNSIFTWGWAFGGSLYDREKQEVTPDDEGVVKALEWMTDYAQSVGGPDRISVTPPNLQLHYFGGGNVAMSPLVSPNARDVEESTDLRTGAGLLPYAPPAEAPGAGAWIGGWSLFVPKGAPYVSAAWEFAYWLSATDAGTKAQWDTVGFPPAYRRAPVLKEIQQDPLMGPFYDTLVTAQHSRPAIPVGSFYTTQLDQLVGDAIYGRLSPLAALREAKKNTMIEWDRFNRQLGITE